MVEKTPHLFLYFRKNLPTTTTTKHEGCVSLIKKIQDWILNLKESENGFSVSLLNRSIQDLPDDGVSQEPKNPLSDWHSLVTFGAPSSE